MLETTSVSSVASFLTDDATWVFLDLVALGVDLALEAFFGVGTTLSSGSDSSPDDASLRLAVDLCRLDRLNGELSGVPLLRFLL